MISFNGIVGFSTFITIVGIGYLIVRYFAKKYQTEYLNACDERDKHPYRIVYSEKYNTYYIEKSVIYDLHIEWEFVRKDNAFTTESEAKAYIEKLISDETKVDKVVYVHTVG